MPEFFKFAFNQNTAPVAFLVLTGFILLLFIWNILLQASLKKLKKKDPDISIENPKNIEAIFSQHSQSIKHLDKDIQELYQISNQIHSLAHRSLHKTGIVRFNPFKDIGGDQSFAIAMLNGKNNGVVISSLYTKEGTRVYSKSIAGGKAEKYPLTEEEEQAIKIAIASEVKKVN